LVFLVKVTSGNVSALRTATNFVDVDVDTVEPVATEATTTIAVINSLIELTLQLDY